MPRVLLDPTLSRMTTWPAAPKRRLSKWQQQARPLLPHSPQRGNGENPAYFELGGVENYFSATQAWLDEKQFYHSQRLGGEPEPKTVEERKKW